VEAIVSTVSNDICEEPPLTAESGLGFMGLHAQHSMTKLAICKKARYQYAHSREQSVHG